MEPKDQIKARLPIQDIIGSYIKIERAGASFRALCPFHKEKSPSFNISPTRDAYYCFGCQKGGDIFAFVMEMEGMTFPEALKVLAEKAGVALPERHQRLPQEQDHRERLFAAMEEATKFYQALLAKNEDAKAYLAKRGLTEDTIAKFRIGFVPEGWRNVYDHLMGKGFHAEDIFEARLTKKVEGKGYYDTFRSRIMFPISDSSGRVIAFTGRVWGNETTSDGSAIAKYLNSPEGELYDKSRVLFAYDRAKIPMRKADRVVLVEGQMDCIMAHQAGAENTVAISGTALTEEQIKLLKRLTENVVLVLDTDIAGANASMRSIGIALSGGLKVKLIVVPNGKDPADYICANPNSWGDVLSKTKEIDEYFTAVFYDKFKDSPEELQEKMYKTIFPLVQALEKGQKMGNTTRDRMLSKMARTLSVREQSVYEDYIQWTRSHDAIAHRTEHLTNTMAPAPALSIVEAPATPMTRFIDELLALIEFGVATPESGIAHAEITSELERITREFGLTLRNIDESGRTRMLMQVECGYPANTNLGSVASELLTRIERELLKDRQKSLLREVVQREAGRLDNSDLLAAHRSLGSRLVALENKK